MRDSVYKLKRKRLIFEDNIRTKNRILTENINSLHKLKGLLLLFL